MMHCFTETWEVASAALDLGFHISFSGIVSFKSAADLRDVAKRVPLERMLIETDAPIWRLCLSAANATNLLCAACRGRHCCGPRNRCRNHRPCDQSKFLFLVSGRAMKRSIAVSLVAALLPMPTLLAQTSADLFQMIELDRPAAVRTALLRGSKVDAVDERAITRCWWRRPAGSYRYWMDAGAKVNQRNKWGDSALMVAALNGHEKTVRYLGKRVATSTTRAGRPSLCRREWPCQRRSHLLDQGANRWRHRPMA